MNWDDYNKVIKDFKGLKIYNSGDPDFFRSHHKLISNFITDIAVLRNCFEKHSENNDYFPSHIDLKNALNLIHGDSSRKKYMNEKMPYNGEQHGEQITRIYEDENTRDGKRINQMSNDMWHLFNKLVNKEIVLKVCKRGTAEFLKCESEILALKDLIKKQEEIENSISESKT